MAFKQPKERTHKFLEITDPKNAVGLWSYRVVKETAMTPVGNTAQALGRFLNGDIARWERRGEMADAISSAKCEVRGAKKGDRKKFKSPATIIAEYREKARQDEKRMSLSDWREKYAWLLAWGGYSCRLAAPNVIAAEKDVQMFFNLASAGVCCHEGNLHGGRVFFLRKKKAKVGGEGEQWKFNYFVCVVLKPGGTKWWWELERVNVTWTDDTYDRLIIDPRGKLEWSPMDAGVLTERVVGKDVCLFQLEDDALFAAITDNDLNPNEKYAHLCYAFDFFYSGGLGKTAAPATNNQQPTTNNFYLRWSAFFNPKKSKFTLASKQSPRIIEIMGERKKGWIARPLAVSDEFRVKSEEPGGRSVRHGNKSITALRDDDARKAQTSDAKLGLGDTPLDRYVQDVARWVVENNGCAVLPIGASRELRLALSHALFFVTFPDRKPDEVGGILRGYQLPGRLVEHVTGKIRGDNSKTMMERVRKQSEESAARRRKMVVDCLFARACAAVLNRNRNVLDEKGVVAKMDEIGARQIIEKAAWQRGFMEGNPLMLFKPSPTAGNLKLPDLSLALGFEHLLGLRGETAGAADLLVQTAPIRSLRESQGEIREAISGVYPCRSAWTPSPGKEKTLVACPADSIRVLRDEGRYCLMAIPKYGQYNFGRDLAFEPDVPGKKNKRSVPIYAYSFRSVGNVRSRSDSFVIEEVMDVNKVMQLARDGRLFLYSIDFGRDKWLADIVYSKGNRQPCKIVPSIPILAPEGTEKKDALQEGRKSGTNVETKVAVASETAQAFITFTFNPTVARDNRKVEGRSWKSYLDAFPSEEKRHIVRLGDCSIEGLRAALQEVIETDGVLLTDKEHAEEAIRAATYVVKDDPYNGYNLKDRIFHGEAREPGPRETASVRQQEDRRKSKAKAEGEQRRELKGKPLCEVLSPDLAKAAEVEFTRQIEADTLVDAKTPKSFKLDEPIKVGEGFRDSVAREFKRIAYTGTMGWRQKLNRPAHEVAVGIWLAGLGE